MIGFIDKGICQGAGIGHANRDAAQVRLPPILNADNNSDQVNSTNSVVGLLKTEAS